MKTAKVYICNGCGKEHETESDAVWYHPDIVIKEYEVKTFKNRKGKQVEFKVKELE